LIAILIAADLWRGGEQLSATIAKRRAKYDRAASEPWMAVPPVRAEMGLLKLLCVLDHLAINLFKHARECCFDRIRTGAFAFGYERGQHNRCEDGGF
jgi:hypothetical protein